MGLRIGQKVKKSNRPTAEKMYIIPLEMNLGDSHKLSMTLPISILPDGSPDLKRPTVELDSEFYPGWVELQNSPDIYKEAK